MDVAWIATDPGSGDLASKENRSDVEGFRSRLQHLLSVGEGYTEVRRVDTDYPQLTFSYRGLAVMHLFASPVRLPPSSWGWRAAGDEKRRSPGARRRLPVSGDFVSSVTRATAAIVAFIDGAPAERLGEWIRLGARQCRFGDARLLLDASRLAPKRLTKPPAAEGGVRICRDPRACRRSVGRRVSHISRRRTTAEARALPNSPLRIKAARKRAAPARPRPAGDLRPASAGPAGHAGGLQERCPPGRDLRQRWGSPSGRCGSGWLRGFGISTMSPRQSRARSTVCGIRAEMALRPAVWPQERGRSW